MDFREVIRVNNTKTKFVIGSYIFIMFLVGILADVAFRPIYDDSIISNILVYITFKSVPYVTCFVVSITIIGIFIISKFGHKLMLSGYDYKHISSDSTENLSFDERQVLNMVEEMSLSANLGYVPKVYILETGDMNAFAAGWNKNNSLVGVTRGLIDNLNRSETQAVIAHEIGHILHGDSKLTLYVGILSNVILTFTNIFIRISFFFKGRRNNASNKAMLFLIILNFTLPLITQVLYLYLSRSREYMADAVSVQLTGDNQAMIKALEKISFNYENKTESTEDIVNESTEDIVNESTEDIVNESTEDIVNIGDKYRSAAYIFSNGDSIFSTHPSIENRIKKLNGN